MHIELDWIQIECIHTECAFTQSRFQSGSTSRGGFDLDWPGLRNCALRVRTKRCGMHMCVDYRQQWEHFSRLHSVFYVSARLEKKYNGWLEYRSDEDTLNLHWAIRLLNRFKSGFGVDNPKSMVLWQVESWTMIQSRLNEHPNHLRRWIW